MKSKQTLSLFIVLLIISCTLLGAGQYSGLLPTNNVQATAPPLIASSTKESGRASGPLWVHPDNPRYFTDGSGKAVFLSGFEFWDILHFDGQESPEAISWSDFLNIGQRHGINFIRLWIWNELSKFRSKSTSPCYTSKEIWMRTGPGIALDGKPKFDLTKHKQAYFDELRERVIQAGERGFYVSIMLFEGWSLRYMEAPWRWDSHPFNVNNNIQGINGDFNGDGIGIEVHTLEVPEVLYYQEQYIKMVIDTVNDLDNVIYEISNEDHPDSTDWQYHIINYIKSYERNHKAKQHPVWMSVQHVASDPGTGFNRILFNSPADCIAPNWVGGYKDNPPAADGRKIVISDTDHLCGCILDHTWVWKSFTRGLNVVNYMEMPQLVDSDPMHVSARNAMGHALQYSKKMNLAVMTPQGDLASSSYALANPGSEYLIYLPPKKFRGPRWADRLGLHKALGWFTETLGWNERVTVDLSASSGALNVEWFNPRTGETIAASPTAGGSLGKFTSPFLGDAVLYIYKA